MATYAFNQVPLNSHDDSAVSVAVSNRSATDSRPGAFFSGDFAAVAPVHFHALGGGKFFGIFAQRWYAITRPSNASDPNLFDSYEVDSQPSWAIFDGINGNAYPIPGQSPINPETEIPYDTRSVVSACSRTNNYLYLMQSYTKSGNTFGVISHFHISPVTGEVNLVGEDTIPTVVVGGETITFNRGVKHTITYLNFVGTDSTGKVYYARKNWGWIGRSTKIEYQSDKGWTEDYSKLVPLKTSDGGYLTTAGPVSFADYRGKTWISTVKNNSGTMTAQLYVSSGSLWDVWKPDNYPYPLGTVGTTYLGGTAYLQPMLRANATAVPPTCVTGIPMVIATKVISGDNEGINLSWDLWPIKSSGVSSSSSGGSLSVNAESTGRLS